MTNTVIITKDELYIIERSRTVSSIPWKDAVNRNKQSYPERFKVEVAVEE